MSKIFLENLTFWKKWFWNHQNQGKPYFFKNLSPPTVFNQMTWILVHNNLRTFKKFSQSRFLNFCPGAEKMVSKENGWARFGKFQLFGPDMGCDTCHICRILREARICPQIFDWRSLSRDIGEKPSLLDAKVKIFFAPLDFKPRWGPRASKIML